MYKRRISSKIIEIEASPNCYLFDDRIGVFGNTRKVCILESDLSHWSEFTKNEQAKVEREEAEQKAYKSIVVEYIRKRYSLNDELALAANMYAATDKRSNEYSEYQAYRQECKQRAKEEVSNMTMEELYARSN
jgi:hypothetical protein